MHLPLGPLLGDTVPYLTFFPANVVCATDDVIGQALEKAFHIVNEDTRAPVENPVSRVWQQATLQNSRIERGHQAR